MTEKLFSVEFNDDENLNLEFQSSEKAIPINLVEGGGRTSEVGDAVRYSPQDLTEEQKAQALANIGGASAESVGIHNTSGDAHNDIRLLIEGLTTRLNALANSDDTTLDQMAEVVAYIKNNKSLIDGITTSKVSVTDIIDNLTTSVANKPLSAKQGVQLKALIDKIVVPTLLSQLSGDATHRTVTDAEKQTWNNKSNFSGNYNDLSNKPTIPSKTSQLANDSGFAKQTDVDNLSKEIVDEEEARKQAIADLKAQGVQQVPSFANSLEELKQSGNTTKLYVLPDGYIYGYDGTGTTEEVETVVSAGVVALKDQSRYSLSGGAFKTANGASSLIVPIESTGESEEHTLQYTGITTDSDYPNAYFGTTPTAFTGTATYKSYSGGKTSVIFTGIPSGKYYVVTHIDRTGTTGEYANASIIVDGKTIPITVTTDSSIASFPVTSTETITTVKGWCNTGRAFVPANYEDRIVDLETKTEENAEDIAKLKKINSVVNTDIADYINSVHCPVQLPANAESEADFNLHTFAGFGGEFNSYFEDLLARYPHYLVREFLGKDSSGKLDMYRYVLGKHYYSAWYKENYPRMYAWKNGNTVVYSTSISPRIGDTLYSTTYIGTTYSTVTAVSATNRSRTANGLEFVRYETGDIEPTVRYTPAYNPNNNLVSKGGSVYATGVTIDGNILTVGGSKYIRYPFGDFKKDWSKPIHMTIITNEHGGDSEPAIPTVVVARLIRDLCKGQLSSNSPIYRMLKDDVQITIIPAVNPHGLNKYASGEFNGYYNANGVNINRNYDTVGWDYCYNNQSVDGNDKLGSYAGSENETQYVMNTMVDSKADIAMSVHTIADTVTNYQRCNYQGQNPNGAYSQGKIDKIADDMKSSYNLNFYAYNPLECPPETTCKSPSFITQIGAYGGIVEFQCHDPLATQEQFASRETMFTAVVMEQNYSLLLKFIAMWLSDYLEGK